MTGHVDIRFVRKERGLTQAEAAEQAGIGSSTFADWEVKGYDLLAQMAVTNPQVRKTKERIDAWLAGCALPPEPECPDSDLKRERERRGVSQEEACRQAGIPPTTWRRWEKQGPIKLEGYGPDTSRGKVKAWLEGEPVVEMEGPAFEVLPETAPDPEIETYRAIAAAIPDHRPALAAALVSFADKLQASRTQPDRTEESTAVMERLVKAQVETREAVITLSEESERVLEGVQAFVMDGVDAGKLQREMNEMLHLVADEVQATRAAVREVLDDGPDEPDEPRRKGMTLLAAEVRGLRMGVASLIELMKESERERKRQANRMEVLWAERRGQLDRQEEEEVARVRAFAERAASAGSSLNPAASEQ